MKPRKRINLNVWPVVQRELREGARRRVNHRLRFWSAGAGMLVLWLIVAHSEMSTAETGSWLLGGLHALMLGLILLIVPALTADCLAREKREGTLGLLFLTPLSAGGIVAGKALAQGLRAFTLWLAMLPILTIPFITGGVTWLDALTAISLEFCATVLCLAAGLLASSLVRDRNRVFLLALILGTAFLLIFGQLFVLCIGLSIDGFKALFDGDYWSGYGFVVLAGLSDEAGYGRWSDLTTGTSPGLGRIWEWLCLSSPAIAMLFFYVIARFAARRVERSWQDQGPSIRHESLLRRYCTPLFRHRFQRKMQCSLDRNPITWLQQYSWKARVSKWGLCLAVLVIEGAALDLLQGGPVGRGLAQMAFWLVLFTIYTFFGVSGFLEEKRSGALELLLVTPISVNKLIYGRVWGLWSQFLPACLLWAGFYVCFQSRQWDSQINLRFLQEMRGPFVLLACGFITLPVFATYFALRVKNLIVAAMLTWVALFIPLFLVVEAGQMTVYRDPFSNLLPEIIFSRFGVLEVFLSYATLTVLACFLLRHSLSRRIYSF